MTRVGSFVCGAVGLLLLCGVVAHAQQAPKASAATAPPSEELRISSYIKPGSLVLKPADLKPLAHITVTVHNEHSKADEIYSGVRVSELLAKVGAPLGRDMRGVGASSYIVATATDAYVAVIALAEIDTKFHSGEVIVADAMNGKPLDAESGAFKLIVTEDKRPARWVRNLISLELKSAK